MSWHGARSAHSSGSVLARARVAAGLTQQELAERSGVSKGTLSNLESGHSKRPRLGTASPIAFALGLTIHDLWPTLAKALKAGRLLDTAIAIEDAVNAPLATKRRGLRLAYSDPEGGTRVRHHHRPPICCGCLFCRVVDLNDPETYRVIAEPTLIAAGGVNG